MEKDKNNKKEKEQELEKNISSRRKFKNKINSFLNSNFQYVSFLMLFFVFWFSFNYILVPKYNKVVIVSNEILESKKDVFIEEYKELISYKKNIEVFESISSSDIDKINKMVPSENSKDDIFMEFAYFLMKNNFNIKSLKVSNPLDSSTTQPGNSRRSLGAVGSNLELDSRITQVAYSLPPNIGSWLIKTEISSIDYIGLKYLLDVIENNLRIVDVVSVDFDPASKNVKLDALVYYFKN
ncbi:MAG TPA: hypothetical protein PK686_00220 [bacterium]|nr:hypothetical protein [bacterium]HPV65093.1 hypothetical protein [bacterium]